MGGKIAGEITLSPLILFAERQLEAKCYGKDLWALKTRSIAAFWSEEEEKTQVREFSRGLIQDENI